MSLYQITNVENSLKPFHSTELGSHYNEKDLEDWIEANPQVLVSDEPLLIIGRQVSIPFGVVDLLALDSEGAVVVVELKRAPHQRKTIAQAIEYAAWLHEKTHTEIVEIAETYLKNKGIGSLSQAWEQAFYSELPNLSPEDQHRIFIVIEGKNEILESVAKYLRSSGVDISLLQYSFYQTKSGDEILLLEKTVGDEASSTPKQSTSQAFPSENELLSKWNEAAREAYTVFKKEMGANSIDSVVKRTQVSYRALTSEGKVFVCSFQGSGNQFKIWLRSDTLSSMFDFQSVADEISLESKERAEIWHTDTWFIVTYPANAENARLAADTIITKIVSRMR